MRLNQFTNIFISLVLVFSGCTPKSQPSATEPVMRQKDVKKTFQPILQFMEYKPGMSFADVGAGSGALTVMMASLMDNSTVYIQDIDATVLTENNINKTIDSYTKQTGEDIRKKNTFHVVIGDVTRTNLPNSSFDLIYSNGTVHNFTSIDSMMIDLGRKLKPGGLLFLRDGFRSERKKVSVCADPTCAKPLLSIDELLTVMTRNGYTLVKRAPDLSGYPVFGFTLAN